MLKFFSWSRHSPILVVNPIFSSNSTHSRLLHCSHLLSQSPSDDAYDPPFSPPSQTLRPTKEKREKKTYSNANSPSKNDHNFPLRSDLPFDFRYSYSETNPSVEAIGFREPPRFSPFGPGRLDRKWTGTSAPAKKLLDPAKVAEDRKAVLEEPLSVEEVADLVERYRHSDCSRQINLGFWSGLCFQDDDIEGIVRLVAAAHTATDTSIGGVGAAGVAVVVPRGERRGGARRGRGGDRGG